MAKRADTVTDKQDLFCREYLKDLNAAAAAERAGYSKRTAKELGYQLMQYPHVRARIQELMDERAKRTEITADYVLGTITEAVERCMQRAPVMVRRGKEMVQLEDDEGRDVWQFDSRGALKGCELLGKHLKLFTEKHEHSADGDLAALLMQAFNGGASA